MHGDRALHGDTPVRTLLAALAALCIAGTGEAKVLITYDITSGSGPNISHEEVRALTSALDGLGLKSGTDYVVAHPRSVRTEFARIGRMTWNFGTAAAYAESFDAVIHCGFNGRQNTVYTSYRPDSLTHSATVAGTAASHGRGLPTVPQLFIFGTEAVTNQGDGTACTTGVSALQTGGEGTGNHEAEGSLYKVGSPGRWFDATIGKRGLRNATSPAGGWRPLIGSGWNSVMSYYEVNNLMPADADSMGMFAFPDTAVLWERPNAHVTGASSNVFMASGNGAGATYSDSLSGLPGWRIEIDWPVLYCALARLDSLAGGNVLKGRSRSLGFVVEGGGTRSDRRHNGGVFAADTTVLRATADSVRALGFPLTIATDPESLAVNAGDIAIWKAFGDVRFAPWVRVGMDTTAALLGNASVSRVVDPFGRYRMRAAVGPGTADSSVYALVLASRNALRSLVGSRYFSNAVVPFADDWSPKQMRLRSALPGVDSLMYALRLAGVSTLVINQQTRDTDPAYLAANPKGFGRLKQQVLPIRIGAVSGDRIALLGFASRPVYGQRFKGIQSDSVDRLCDPGPCPGPVTSWYTENAFWNGMHRDFTSHAAFLPYNLGGSDEGVILATEDKLYGMQGPASVCVINAQSLAGENLVNPTRPGWYVLKHIVNATRAANAFAGRTVLRIAHLDEVQP